MKTINLTQESPSLNDLLALARNDSVRLVSEEGTTFVLEEADDFDREVTELGQSKRFKKFLDDRATEKGVVSIEGFAQGLAGLD